MTDKTLEIDFVRHRLEKFQSAIVQDVERRMAGMIDDVIQEIRQHELQTLEFRNFAHPQRAQTSSTWSNRIDTVASGANATDKAVQDCQSAKEDTLGVPNTSEATTESSAGPNTPKELVTQRSLPDKVFKTRESYLTALLQVDHMKSIYHIFHVILICQFLNSVLYDYYVEGRVNFGLGTFKSGFLRIEDVALAWLAQHIFVFALYYAFKGWATVRHRLRKQASLRGFWSHSCLIVYVSSQLVFGYVATVLCLRLDLPFPTASVLLLETTRLLMKMHAFVRVNASKVLAGKLKVDADEAMDAQEVVLPRFGWYVYFLFAPTLIYRDSYPRTAQIRWKFAFARLMEVVAVAFLYSYIHERHIAEHFANMGREALSESSLLVKLFGMLMPSIVILLCGFYMILHSWLNFTSELLRFGDRMFYKDWWTSSSYEVYYRNWNVVVHDWLYEYIYRDSYRHIFKGSKIAASLMVFLISAAVHEVILGFALQLFFPVIFAFFGVLGVWFIFLTKKMPKSLGNLFVWFTLIFGNGLMISLYSMEYYARLNSPKTYEGWLDYLKPALWDCYMK